MIHVTQRALSQIRNILKSTNTEHIRIGITKYGCNGMTYNMKPCDKIETHDELLDKDGIKIVFCPKTFFYVFGTTIDYQSNKLSSSFTFENPNIQHKCGCGKSFTI